MHEYNKVATIAALRALPNMKFADHTVCFVEASGGDWYILNREAAGGDDGVNTVIPQDTHGRWQIQSDENEVFVKKALAAKMKANEGK